MWSSPTDQEGPDRRNDAIVDARFAVFLIILALLLPGCIADGEAETDPATQAPTASPHAPGRTAVPEPSPSSTPIPQPTTASPSSTSTPPPNPTLPSEPAVTPSEPPPIIGAVLQRAAEEFGVSPDVIALDSFSERFWSTTALGCPVPGKSYAQVIVGGYKVIVTVEGRPVVYHTGDQHIVRCDESVD